MEAPQVQNRLIDERRGITYDVLAYRRLTREELLGAVRTYAAQQRRPPKRGTVVTIVSIIGHDSC